MAKAELRRTAAAGGLRVPGTKWSCTMKLAVRVLKALPDEDR
jgi:hypothetical protein